VETLCTADFINLKNTKSASQHICVYHMILRIKR